MWSLEVLGETFTELDCTPSLAERIEDATGLRWNGVGLTLLRGEIKAIRRTAGVLLCDRFGWKLDDAYSKLDEAYKGKLDDLIGSVTAVDDDLPTVMENGNPQSAGEISTPG